MSLARLLYLSSGDLRQSALHYLDVYELPKKVDYLD